MLLSYNWLKDYLDTVPPVAELSERLTMTGTEVEAVTETAPRVTGVFVAEVVEKSQHPNADRLSLCTVTTGEETYSIVCGARNMGPGDRVPLALNGAVLKDGFKIKKSKIRGIESAGMMCSAVELGLAEESDGLLILPKDAPLGADINDVVERDYVLDLSITPNRADLLSVRGVARELAAISGGRYTEKDIKVVESGEPIDTLASVTVEAPAECPRYAARVITGVKVGPTPPEVVKRLEAVGLRSVNNVVDVTNYVLMELGSPMHAFDLDRLEGRSIIVRNSAEGEKITTIDGVERELAEGTLVIADAGRPVALAGVMGGAETEVGDSTTNILLECAYFDPPVVRRSSRAAALSSDSSFRFERGVDISAVTTALDMASAMITELAGGVIAEGTIDIHPESAPREAIEFRVARAESLLGLPLTEGEVTTVLESLGMTVEKSAAAPTREGVLTVTPPSYRGDIVREVDITEEIARIIGFDKIPTTLPAASIIPGMRTSMIVARNTLKNMLINAGFFEVVNYSFVSRDLYSVTSCFDPGIEPVSILNPLGEDTSVMRSSLLPSLLANLRHNLQHKNEDVRIFEISSVFFPDSGKKLPRERWRASGLMSGHRWAPAWNYPTEPVDFYDVKGVVEGVIEAMGIEGAIEIKPLEDNEQKVLHPGKSAVLVVDGEEAGLFGETHPDVAARFELRQPSYLFELDMDALVAASTNVKSYTPLPRYPDSTRDVAFVLDATVPYAEIINSIKRLGAKLIERVELFDVYCGEKIPEGKRSLAIRIVCRSAERTLKQAEVDKIFTKVTRELEKRFGAEVRG